MRLLLTGSPDGTICFAPLRMGTLSPLFAGPDVGSTRLRSKPKQAVCSQISSRALRSTRSTTRAATLKVPALYVWGKGEFPATLSRNSQVARLLRERSDVFSGTRNVAWMLGCDLEHTLLHRLRPRERDCLHAAHDAQTICISQHGVQQRFRVSIGVPTQGMDTGLRIGIERLPIVLFEAGQRAVCAPRAPSPGCAAS